MRKRDIDTRISAAAAGAAIEVVRSPAIQILDARIDPVILELRARAFNYEARLTLRKKPKNL